jgi:hypothetical protein
MFEAKFTIILAVLTGIALISLPLVNRFYQKRADDFADNLLKDIPKEYNRQIKSNAYRHLINYWILAILSGWLGLYDIQNQSGTVFIYKIVYLLISLSLFTFGFWSYKKELKKLLVEEQVYEK